MILAPTFGNDPALTVSWLYSGLVMALILGVIWYAGGRRR